MRTFSYSNFHPVQWLATGVTALFTWPMALALHLANKVGRAEADANADDTTPDEATYTGYCWTPGERFGMKGRYVHGYFGRYRW
jgi:hypothetical protein